MRFFFKKLETRKI